MKQTVRALMVGILSATLGVAGCGPSQTTSGGGGDDDDDDTGPGPGPDTTAVASCAAACTTDLDAARLALVSGDYPRAFDLYRCADTPEAAFGAGLTRALLAFDGNNAASVLADFGQPPLRMTDIFGLDGVLAREAARWTGEGNLTLTGALSATLPFDRAMHEVSDEPEYSIGTVRAYDGTSPANADITLSLYADTTSGPLANGTVLAVTSDCTSTFPTVTRDPRLGYLDLYFDVVDQNYWCEIPYSPPAAGCEADGGSVVVTAAAAAPGQPASYQFNNLLLQCTPSEGIVDGTDGLFVRVTGSISTTAVSATLDTTGLHPIITGDASPAAQIPAGTSLTRLLQHSGSTLAELEHAACFFKIAGQGSGHIYDVPGALFAGPDVPFSKGDTELVAAFMLLGAASGHLAWVHEIDMQLDQLVCDSEDPAATPCLGAAEFAASFNRSFASDFHPGRFLTVERLTADALALLDQGIADLDANSLIPRDSTTSAGLDALRTLVQASLESIRNGQVALPHVTPTLNVNFKALFENPRNPRSLGPVLRYEETCELDECYGETVVDTAFLQRYFEGRIDADWDGSYEWTDSDAFGNALEEAGNSATRYSSFGD